MIIPYFTDTHISGKNSEHRIGDYYSDIIAKFKEILMLAKEWKSKFILGGGDLIDSPIISLTICDEIIDLVEKAGIPIYTLVGNHPMFNHEWGLSQASTMAHIFRRTKMIKKLDILEGEDYLIRGYDYCQDIENLIKKSAFNCQKQTKKWAMAVVHAFLTKEPFLPQVSHIPVSEIDSDYGLVLCAHNHTPFTKLINETKYINPGCIGRTAINEADIQPSIVLLDTEKREAKLVKLESAKPKEEIFDLTKIATIKKFDNEINEFIASLQTTKFTDLDLMGMIKEIGKQKNIEKEVIEEVTNRITKYDA